MDRVGIGPSQQDIELSWESSKAFVCVGESSFEVSSFGFNAVGQCVQ